MNPIERVARRIDRIQQGFGPAAFVFGVVKKFGDDRAGSLAALIAYYGFITLFPLLLLLVTVLGIVAGHDKSLAQSLERSALGQFPVIGSTLGQNIKALTQHSTVALVVSVVGLLWGSQGAVQAAQFAMAQVWNVPGVVRPNFWSRLGRTYAMLGVLALFLVLSTAAAWLAGFAGRWPLVAQGGTVLLSVVVNVILYVLAFRVLTPKQVGVRGLLPGAILGGAAWTALQLGGAALINHTLRHVNQLYGFFAIVLGLIAWIYLAAQVTMYVAEVNVVLARRLWPRALVQPPLTDADRRVLAAISEQEVRRPEQTIQVTFTTQEQPTGPEDGPPA